MRMKKARMDGLYLLLLGSAVFLLLGTALESVSPVSMIDFKVVRPGIINYESMHLSPERSNACEALLKSHGYRIIKGFADVIAYL